MNGPEHYREAEQHLKYAAECGATDPRTETLHLAYAQVHATLAHVAAVATMDATEGPNGGSATGRTVEDYCAWADVLGGGK
jgi:hypothetical protein